MLIVAGSTGSRIGAALRRLSYRPELIKLARVFGLRGLLRRLYYRWARPRDGILSVGMGGLGAQFFVRTPEELRLLESAGGAGGEHRILELMISFLRPGDVAYDIGANVGLYTVLLAKAVGSRGQVVAFEPASLNYENLQNNLRLNGLGNVRCFRKALADESGEGRLRSTGEIMSLTLVRSASGTRAEELVDTIEGDQAVAVENLPLPRVVKIDVEGYEYAVIQGMRHTLAHRACELVSCEVHPNLLPPKVDSEKVRESLISLGFHRVDTFPRWGGTLHLVAYKPGAVTA